MLIQVKSSEVGGGGGELWLNVWGVSSITPAVGRARGDECVRLDTVCSVTMTSQEIWEVEESAGGLARKVNEARRRSSYFAGMGGV
jgi:hypothetical protein